jgi:uncharacterized repeat protein (TIGR01451 family)
MSKRVLTAASALALALAMVTTVLAVGPTAPHQAVPDGFRISVYADLGPLTALGFQRNPTAVAVGPDGRVYVALESGRIYAFEDTNGDYAYDAYQKFAEGQGLVYFPGDLVWYGDVLYTTVPGMILKMEDLDSDGDALDDPENEGFVTWGIPEPLRGLAIDAEGRVYVGVAADCDNCQPPDVRQGAILRFNADGSNGVIYALGLHDPYGLAFHPTGGALFATDDGRDDLGSSLPPDELNLVQAGRHYGWPHCWQGGADPGWGYFCTWAVPPVATFPAHSSPAGLVIHDGTAFPPGYAGNAFVALQDLGRVDRVVLTPDGSGGYQGTASSFATGFVKPVDVAAGPDGALYVVDRSGRKVYVIRARTSLAGSTKTVFPVNPGVGEALTYTLRLQVIGPGTPFMVTDTIPALTTYVPGSAWASGGLITYGSGKIAWQGTISSNSALTATFAVQLGAGAVTGTTIVNTAWLSATEDEQGPYTLRAWAIVGARQCFLPAVYRQF